MHWYQWLSRFEHLLQMQTFCHFHSIVNKIFVFFYDIQSGNIYCLTISVSQLTKTSKYILMHVNNSLAFNDRSYGVRGFFYIPSNNYLCIHSHAYLPLERRGTKHRVIAGGRDLDELSNVLPCIALVEIDRNASLRFDRAYRLSMLHADTCSSVYFVVALFYSIKQQQQQHTAGSVLFRERKPR